MDTETLAFTPATQLAEMIRHEETLAGRVDDRPAGTHRRVESAGQCFRLSGCAMQRWMRRGRPKPALMTGERIGRLHGIPVTIKDLAITKDMPTQKGSPIFAGNQPTEDTPIVPRLRDEGAIILGKTTTSEFGWTGVSAFAADRHHA